jgi:hypothetical protein
MLQRNSRKRFDGSINVQLSGSLKIFTEQDTDTETTDTNSESERFVTRTAKDLERILAIGGSLFIHHTYDTTNFNYLVLTQNEILSSNIYFGKNIFNAIESYLVEEVHLKAAQRISFGYKKNNVISARIPEILFLTKNSIKIGNLTTTNTLHSKNEIIHVRGETVCFLASSEISIGKNTESVMYVTHFVLKFKNNLRMTAADDVSFITNMGNVTLDGAFENTVTEIFYGGDSSYGRNPTFIKEVKCLEKIKFLENLIRWEESALLFSFESQIVFENTDNEKLLILDASKVILKNNMTIKTDAFFSGNVGVNYLYFLNLGVSFEEDFNISTGGLVFSNVIIMNEKTVVDTFGDLRVQNISKSTNINCVNSEFSGLHLTKKIGDDESDKIVINDQIKFSDHNIVDIEELRSHGLKIRDKIYIYNDSTSKDTSMSHVLIEAENVAVHPTNELILHAENFIANQLLLVGDFVCENDNISNLSGLVSSFQCQTKILNTPNLEANSVQFGDEFIIDNSGVVSDKNITSDITFVNTAVFGSITIQNVDDDIYDGFIKCEKLVLNSVEFGENSVEDFSCSDRFYCEKIMCNNTITKNQDGLEYSWVIEKNDSEDYIIKLLLAQFNVNDYNNRAGKKGQSYTYNLKVLSANNSADYFFISKKIILVKNTNEFSGLGRISVVSETIHSGYSESMRNLFTLDDFVLFDSSGNSGDFDSSGNFYGENSEIFLSSTIVTPLLLDTEDWNVTVYFQEDFDSLPECKEPEFVEPSLNSVFLFQFDQALEFVTLTGKGGLDIVKSLNINSMTLEFAGKIDVDASGIFYDDSNDPDIYSNFIVKGVEYNADLNASFVEIQSNGVLNISRNDKLALFKIPGNYGEMNVSYPVLVHVTECTTTLEDFQGLEINTDIAKQISILPGKEKNNSDYSKHYVANIGIVSEKYIYFLSSEYIPTKITFKFNTLSGTTIVDIYNGWESQIIEASNEIVLTNTSMHKEITNGLSMQLCTLSDTTSFITGVKLHGMYAEFNIYDTNLSENFISNITNLTYFYYREDSISSKYFSPVFSRVDIENNYLVFTSSEYTPADLTLQLNTYVLQILQQHPSLDITIIEKTESSETVFESSTTINIKFNDNVIMGDGKKHTLCLIEPRNIVNPVKITDSSGSGFNAGGDTSSIQVFKPKHSDLFYFERFSRYYGSEDFVIEIVLGKPGTTHLIKSLPIYGNLSLDSSGLQPIDYADYASAPSEVFYTPFENYNVDVSGVDSFLYLPSGATLETLVELTIYPVNDQPISYSRDFFGPEDSVIRVDLGGTDVEDDVFKYTLLTLPFSDNSGDSSGYCGDIFLNIDCTDKIVKGQQIDQSAIYFCPKTDFYGNVHFTYNIEDSSGGISEDSDIHVRVTPVNDIPFGLTLNSSGTVLSETDSNGIETFDNVTFYTVEDSILKIVLKGEDIEDARLLQFKLIEVQHGNIYAAIETREEDKLNILDSNNEEYLTFNPETERTKDIYFKPHHNFYGDAFFTYKVYDTSGGVSNLNTVNVRVTEDDYLPVPIDKVVEVREGVRVEIKLEASDQDGETNGKYRIIKLPSNSRGDLFAFGELFSSEFSNVPLTVNSEVTGSVWFMTEQELNPEPLVFFRYRAQQSRNNRWSTQFGTVQINITSG